MRSFMLGTSLLLALLALVLVGKGVRALQEADWLGTTTVLDLRFDALGLFGTAQGLAAQGLVVALLLASAAWSRRQARRRSLLGTGAGSPRPPTPPATGGSLGSNGPAPRTGAAPRLSPTAPPRT